MPRGHTPLNYTRKENNKMKKVIALALGAVMCLGLLAACGTPAANPTPTPTEPAMTPEELSAHYAEAITGARDEQENTDRPIISTDEEMGTAYWDVLGFTADDVDAFAVSISLMNVQAYCVGVFKPAEGKTETVMTALQAYIDNMVQSFTNYLPDQLTIAESAKLEQLDDGTVVIVMCENQDTVYAAIAAAL